MPRVSWLTLRLACWCGWICYCRKLRCATLLGAGSEKLPTETSPSSADDPTTTTTGPQSPEEAFAQAQQLLNAVSSKPQVQRVQINGATGTRGVGGGESIYVDEEPALRDLSP